MTSVFRRDPEKARSILAKHGVSFEEAASAFRDALSVTVGDPLHSTDENRFVTMGRSERGRALVVVHSDYGDSIRIISARIATRRERKKYEEGTL